MDNTNEIADEMSEGRDVVGAVPYKCVVWLFRDCCEKTQMVTREK